MWNREKFKEQMEKENISIWIWGRFGINVVNELENSLNFKFPAEVRSFIEEIGNVSIGGTEFLFSGAGADCRNCISETEDIGLLKENQPPEGIKIIDNAGVSYILYSDGSIKAYEFHYVQPDGIVFSYDSFSDLMKSTINEILNDDL